MADQTDALTDVGVLGPLRLRIDDAWVGVGAPRQRMVLGVLLAHAGEVVSSERLLHEAWGGQPPNAGVQALRYHLARLRDLLVPGRGRGVEGPIRTVGSGYRLEAGFHTDADRFERLAARGTESAASQQWAEAIDSFDEALRLWRGNAWADFRYEDFAQPQIRRLEERRLHCLEERIDARLWTGASSEVVAELRELTARHPARERFWGQTILALRRAGRDAEAAAVYESARRTLQDLHGVAPGAQLQRLHDGVVQQPRRHDDVPAPERAPARDRRDRQQHSAHEADRADVARPATARRPDARRHRPRTRGALLERDEELAILRHEQSTAARRGGRVVLVRGEAGIGKTSLVNRFRADVADDASTYLGRCDDLGTPQPWAPLWDVSRDHPDLAAALGSGDRRRVMDATLDALAPSGGAGVLVVEDTQWADDATLDVILYVGRRIDRTGGLLLLTYRDGDVDHDHPLRRVLGMLPAARVTRLSLKPLSVEAVGIMLTDRSRDAQRLHEVTGGNPLFVSEMLDADGDDLPRSVRDAVLARLSRLSTRSRQLVELVSVVPGHARWAVVERVLGTDRLGSRPAVRQGLLATTDDGVAFRHELQRRAVEASLTPPARRRLHRQILAALGDDADPARLAHHARHAGDTEALLVHAARAGRRALSAHSHTQAVEHFASLEPHIDSMPVDEAAAVVEGWARAEWHAGGTDTAPLTDRAVALRRAVGDGAALSRVLSFGAFVLMIAGRGEEGLAWAAEAVALAEQSGPSSDLAYALTEQARVVITVGPAGQIARRAVEIAEAIGDDRTACSALNLVGMSSMYDDPAEAIAIVERARARADVGRHHFEEADACCFLGLLRLAWFGDLEQAAEELHRSRRLAAEHEFLDLLTVVDAIMAMVHLRRGRWREAERVATDVLEAGPPPDALVIAEIVHVLLATRRDLSGAQAAVRRLWARATELGMPHYREQVAAVLAEHLWLRDVDDSPSWAVGMDDMLRLHLDDPPRNDFGRLLFWGAMAGLLPAQPTSLDDGFAAVLDGHEAAEAAALWHERGWPYEEAIALMHGSADDATRAVRILEELGADGTIARARQLLRDRGIMLPRGRSRAAREHAAGLTERQAEVLDLLATGASNSEIADELFISRRTVENHVTEVLRKLDAGDRDEAVATARTRGLLGDDG